MASPLGEFGRIARYFSPLTAGFPGARGLLDDTASLIHGDDRELIVTTDAIVAGVHFIGDEPAGLIGRKALRTNLSDLASAGAIPLAYTLTAILPRAIDDAWVAALAEGLALDQAEFGIHLAGGDSVSTPGPLALSITAFGTAPRGRAVTRRGARPGDLLFVTGTLGDAALGLAVAQGRLTGDATAMAWLLDRYRLPRPRTRFGAVVLGPYATAGIDVSDGLVADVGHLAAASQVAITIDAAALPRSEAAGVLATEPMAEDGERRLLAAMLTGGDDYELALTISPENVAMVRRLSGEMGLAVTPVGRVTDGSPGVRVVGRDGADLTVGVGGYRHV